MQYRKMGRSDVEISVMTMGCWALAGGRTWGPQDEEDAIAALKAAVDYGINFFDTAEGYGNGRSEELVGRALSDVRDKILIATKVSSNHLRPKDLRAACEGSLKALGTDYIDVYYIHWPNWDVPIEETLGAMEALKEEGKIRFVGCSNFGQKDLTDLFQYGRVEIDQLPYNLLCRAIEYEILPTCIEHDVSVACYSPLLHGILTGKFETLDDIPEGRARSRHFSSERKHTRHGGPGAEELTAETLDKIQKICRDAGLTMTQVSIAWLLKQQGVATVIAGARNPEQVEANVKAALTPLSDDVAEALREATEPLKEELGPTADLWEAEENSRIR
jgi:myo-inositol catabolism protein IolS